MASACATKVCAIPSQQSLGPRALFRHKHPCVCIVNQMGKPYRQRKSLEIDISSYLKQLYLFVKSLMIIIQKIRAAIFGMEKNEVEKYL